MNHTNIIKEIFKTHHIADKLSIEKLSGGFSASGVYKITTNSKKYIAKFANKHRSYADNLHSYNAMQIASSKNIAPNIIFSSTEKDLIIMDYIPQYKFSNLSTNKIFIAKLASKISQLHNGKKFEKFKSIFNVVKEYYSIIQNKNHNTISIAFTKIKKNRKQNTRTIFSKTVPQ